MAGHYPSTDGGVRIGEAARARAFARNRAGSTVDGPSWLVHFVRQRLMEVALAISVMVSIGLLLDRFTPALLLSSVGSSGPVTLEVPDLELGTYRAYDGQHSRLYVLRSADDDVRAFTVPLRGGKVEMPAAQWGRSAYDCADFGPQSNDGVLSPHGVFRCRDPAVPAWGGARWRWNLDGSPAPLIDDTYIGALPRVTSVRVRGVIRIYRWDILW
jgi:hypothetical protein